MIKRTAYALALILALSLAAPKTVLAQQTPKEGGITFGSVAMDIPVVMQRRLLPLTDYLSEKIGGPVSLRLSPSMKDAIDKIATGQVDLAYLTPVAYLRAHEKGNVRIAVKTVTNNRDSFQLMIAVREDSTIETIRDLAGKTFAFGDPAALLQRAVVVNAGMPLEKFGDYKFIGHYDNIVRGIVSGDFDAGILKDTMAQAWTGKGIRILYTSPRLPPYNIAVSGNIDDALFGKIQKAFLDLDARNPRHKKIIEALDKRYGGFTITNDREYDIIRKLTKPFWDKK